jgi:hypothetical protein
MHGARDEDASGVGSRAQPRGKLHCGAEEVVTFGDRFTCGHPDADADGHSAGAFGVRDSPLDLQLPEGVKDQDRARVDRRDLPFI